VLSRGFENGRRRRHCRRLPKGGEKGGKEGHRFPAFLLAIRFSMENSTANELTVLMVSAFEKSLVVPAGGSTKVEVASGTYRVLGRVNAANVLPFSGIQDFESGSTHQESFYIK